MLQLLPLDQVQPPTYDRAIFVFDANRVTSPAVWHDVSRTLHQRFINFVVAHAPFLTSAVHRDLAPPHRGTIFLREPGTHNPVVRVGLVSGWVPTAEQRRTGNIASWPWAQLDPLLDPASLEDRVPIGGDATLFQIKLTWCEQGGAVVESGGAAEREARSVVCVCVRWYRCLGDFAAIAALVRAWWHDDPCAVPPLRAAAIAVTAASAPSNASSFVSPKTTLDNDGGADQLLLATDDLPREPPPAAYASFTEEAPRGTAAAERAAAPPGYLIARFGFCVRSAVTSALVDVMRQAAHAIRLAEAATRTPGALGGFRDETEGEDEHALDVATRDTSTTCLELPHGSVAVGDHLFVENGGILLCERDLPAWPTELQLAEAVEAEALRFLKWQATRAHRLAGRYEPVSGGGSTIVRSSPAAPKKRMAQALHGFSTTALLHDTGSDVLAFFAPAVAEPGTAVVVAPSQCTAERASADDVECFDVLLCVHAVRGLPRILRDKQFAGKYLGNVLHPAAVLA